MLKDTTNRKGDRERNKQSENGLIRRRDLIRCIISERNIKLIDEENYPTLRHLIINIVSFPIVQGSFHKEKGHFYIKNS